MILRVVQSFTVALLLSISLLANAQNGPCGEALATFSRSFDDPEVYCYAMCGRNVRNLLQRFESSAISLDNTQVIYILAEKKKFPPVPVFMEARGIEAAQTRYGKMNWSYHAVVLHEGVIMDLDFTKDAVEPRTYFEALFPKDGLSSDDPYHDPDHLSHVFVRPIPAKDYLRDYRKLDTFEVVTKYRKKDLPEYPITSVREFLDRP